MSEEFRELIISRLKEDLVGPIDEAEVFSDRPTQRYSTGILYPRGSTIQPHENEDGGLQTNVHEDVASALEESGVSLHTTFKPSSMGISFSIEPAGASQVNATIQVSCAKYDRFAVDEDGKETAGKPTRRTLERWRRRPMRAAVKVGVTPGETRTDLGTHGIRGLELYILVVPRDDILTITIALTNKNTRGDSSAFDEEQHFFQSEVHVTNLTGGKFAPRKSRRAEVDDDSRAASLIYRNNKEYVVGHTCAASTCMNDAGEVRSVKSEWIPAAIVKSVSDQGDEPFHAIRSVNGLQPLTAKWLSSAGTSELVAALQLLVDAYRTWIRTEEDKLPSLEKKHRKQAKLHLDRCATGANRMDESIQMISEDDHARTSFQLAQEAMHIQFAWGRPGATLVWRPFQLAFQLLVLTSVADATNDNRETLDLLWFPTGGGKTEAYLGLAAFVIFLRRFRSDSEEGCGVAVLMRYTLRLLTIQQFQRAAALICACEMLRRRMNSEPSESTKLGKLPIGIGLWVGAAATPLTLRDAISRKEGDSSTPKQLTNCPCCQTALRWKITRRESKVECDSDQSSCELAASGARLPVWTIDEEIYRNSPSLLIGTVDKFAQIVRNLNTRSIFGTGTTYAPPDLIIQDELHLISGPLGTMAGLYEVAIDELCRNDDTRVKIVGSTATIRRAVDQARALFDRDTYQFPSPGIDSENSGFAVTQHNSPGRLYVGITTAGRSATYMLQAINASLLQSALDSRIPEQFRDNYWTLVTYFNSLRELGRALVLMQDDVPVSIEQFASRRDESVRTLSAPAELTSRVRSHEIRDMLEQLHKTSGTKDAVDLLLASNMISVGIDIPRLGMMVVNAQPKTLSEYIQATSRVGRGQVPGLIVTMYNSTRPRDRSHYESFETWHRSLYRDVEATSVTPFASRALDKALHAVLVALVRHKVTGMENSPKLNDLNRAKVESIASIIEQRVASVDPREHSKVKKHLEELIDEWSSRTDLQSYWDDYEKKTSLLMSAEQFAATAQVDPNLDPGGAKRALWPTPNSMREVEAGTPFVLRNYIKSGEDS